MVAGKPVTQLAEELCLSSNLLYNWRLKSQEAQGGSAGARTVGEGSEADALRLLLRENALLKEENLILKKPLENKGKTKGKQRDRKTKGQTRMALR